MMRAFLQHYEENHTHTHTYIYVFTTEGFLEVAIESWPEWDLNPRPLNSCAQVFNSNPSKNQT